MKTTEGNKLIAEFMGLAYCERYNYTGWYKNAEFNHRICDFDGLKYHSSWDWLMPVVEKISTLEKEEFFYHWFSFGLDYIAIKIERNRNFYEKTYNFSRNQFKEIMWIACVEFIKWYNAQNVTK